ncbi:hypothetical protein Gohar_007732 [Gossypium harknessii]|uniref:Uncharacterized protein n=1 Tax=Gossypium harknessii TaxID=34285 RepID=A0A7J9GHI4_9ROSI|nr:hypothetical protein [Gossypium harknessii]
MMLPLFLVSHLQSFSTWTPLLYLVVSCNSD